MRHNIIYEDNPYSPHWGKYEIRWCHTCDKFFINCPLCHENSCVGITCDVCDKDIKEFNGFVLEVEHYLTQEEMYGYWKGLIIKEFMKESLSKGEAEINWKQMSAQGELHPYEKEHYFKDFLK